MASARSHPGGGTTGLGGWTGLNRGAREGRGSLQGTETEARHLRTLHVWRGLAGREGAQLYPTGSGVQCPAASFQGLFKCLWAVWGILNSFRFWC